MFSFDVKVKNISQAIAKAKSAVESSGASFEGDNQKGKFSGKKMGMELSGSYVAGVDVIKITIDKKPFLASEEMIKAEVEKFFRIA